MTLTRTLIGDILNVLLGTFVTALCPLRWGLFFGSAANPDRPICDHVRLCYTSAMSNATTNDITGDKIQSRPVSASYRANYDAIFGVKTGGDNAAKERLQQKGDLSEHQG
jgi:hypothetical protein